MSIISRPRLRAALERNILHHKLTLVSAPTGCGKTTLLAEWVQNYGITAVWLSITDEEEDRDRLRLCAYLLSVPRPSCLPLN